MSALELALTNIKQQLSDLRKDRSKYLSQQSVTQLYQVFGDVIGDSSDAEIEENEQLLNDVLLLFSLALLTVGMSHVVPARYASAITMRALLNYISSDAALTLKEQETLETDVNTLTAEVESDRDESPLPHVPRVWQIVRSVVSDVNQYSAKAASLLADLQEDEIPVYSQLTHMRRGILSELVTGKSSPEQYEQLKAKLEKIKTHVAGHSSEGEPSRPLGIQLSRVSIIVEWTKHTSLSEDDIAAEDPKLVPVYVTLTDILSKLEVLVMTRRWTMRGTDLYQYIKQLAQMMPSLKFSLSSDWDDASKYRFMCGYMSRRCWVLLYKLLTTTEAISESLLSIYNQLLTMKRCLGEVQSAGGISNLRELWPYQMKLASLDNLRSDGQFVVEGEIPPGQGRLNELLAQCFDIVDELKVELDENEGEDSTAADDDDDDENDFVDDDDDDVDINDVDSTVERKSPAPENDDSSFVVTGSKEPRDIVPPSSDDADVDTLADVPEARE